MATKVKEEEGEGGTNPQIFVALWTPSCYFPIKLLNCYFRLILEVSLPLMTPYFSTVFSPVKGKGSALKVGLHGYGQNSCRRSGQGLTNEEHLGQLN